MENIVQIQIGSYTGGTSGYITLDKALPISLNYSVAEIQDISKKNSAFSQTITIPGDKNNNKLLGHLFNINITDASYNLNQKQKCIVIVNGIPVLNGYVQLLSVKKLSPTNPWGDENIKYEILIFENKVNFFDALGDGYLEDIDLSLYNHTWTAGTIMAAASNTWQQGYVYPMTHNTSTSYYEVADFYPAIFAKTYLKKMAWEGGYTLIGDFINSDPFTKLIIPYNGDYPIISQNPYARQFQVSLSSYTPSVYHQINTPIGLTSNTLSSVMVSGGAKVMWNDDTNLTAGNYDSGNTFNVSTGRWVCPHQGVYDFDVNLSFTLTLSSATNGWLMKDNPGIGLNVISQRNLASGYQMTLVKNGTTIIATQNSISAFQPPVRNLVSLNYGVGPDLVANTNYATTVNAQKTATGISLFAGEYIEVFFRLTQPYNTIDLFYVDGSNSTWTGNTGLPSAAIFGGPPAPSKKIVTDLAFKYNTSIASTNRFSNTAYPTTNNSLQEGDTIELNNFIPKKVKKKDFFSSLVNMFNLYIEQDPDNEKGLVIKTRDEYYSGNTYVDWTDKIELNKDNTITFLSQLQAKKIDFTYKQDTDYLNKSYYADTNYTWGEYVVNFNNDFLKDTKKIELVFSPTPNEKNGFGLVVPSINSRQPKNNVRILYYAGLKTGNWKFKYVQNAAYVTTSQTSYPYAGHINDPYNPTISLDFGFNEYVFYSGLQTVTNNTLYNTYWYNYINGMADGKLLTAYFNLTEKDILNLKFSDKVFIKDSYYIINKVIDYNPVNRSLTKVELIRINEGLKVLPKVKNINLGNTGTISLPKGSVGGNQNAGRMAQGAITNPTNEVYSLRPGFVGGNMNYISADVIDSMIMSDSNYADSSNNLVVLGGSGNTISADNIVMLNTSNKTVTVPGSTYIGNAQVKNGQFIPGYNDIDSGVDCVLNPFYTSNENDINSGIDAIRNIGGMSPIMDFDSKEDSIQ